jgi:hypothetical protein
MICLLWVIVVREIQRDLLALNLTLLKGGKIFWQEKYLAR